MRATLRIIAAIVLLAALVWWWRAGSHTGWTKTSVQVWKYDEITEISYPETVKRFVPGVDFLAASAAGAAILAGASLLFRRKAPGAKSSAVA
jgi:hypothetical protein